MTNFAAKIRRLFKKPEPTNQILKSFKVDKHLDVINNYKVAIGLGGYKSIKLCHLMRDFGYKKRGSSNIEKINHLLKNQKMFCYPLIKMKTDWKENLRIYEFPVKAEGDVFEDELMLQEYMNEKHLFSSIGVPSVIREESPKGTQDRFDFYCKMDKTHVIIEVKNRDGGKTGVQQLLKYNGIIKNQYPGEPVRKILVTGISDFGTAYAIHGMMQQQREQIEWYIYKWDKKRDTISLVAMNYDSYKDYFAPHKTILN
jgi:hypothetical protein